MTASDIVRKIAGEHGLSPNVTSTNVDVPVHAAGQRDRPRLRLAAREPHRIRVHRRRQDRALPARRLDAADRARVAATTSTTSGPRLTGVQQVDKVDRPLLGLEGQGGPVGSGARPKPDARRSALSATTWSRPSAAKSSILIPTEPTSDRGARPTSSPRRCWTAWPTPTSPPRAPASATRTSAPARSSRSRASARRYSGTYRVLSSTHTLQGGGAYDDGVLLQRRCRRSPGAVGAGPAAGLRQPVRDRHRHQQRRPRGAGPRPRQVPDARRQHGGLVGAGRVRPAPARSAG